MGIPPCAERGKCPFEILPKMSQRFVNVIAIVNVVNVCYCGMLLRRRARNLMIHVVHLKVNFHRLKISVFDLDRAVCKILNSGSRG